MLPQPGGGAIKPAFLVSISNGLFACSAECEIASRGRDAISLRKIPRSRWSGARGPDSVRGEGPPYRSTAATWFLPTLSSRRLSIVIFRRIRNLRRWDVCVGSEFFSSSCKVVVPNGNLFVLNSWLVLNKWSRSTLFRRTLLFRFIQPHINRSKIIRI